MKRPAAFVLASLAVASFAMATTYVRVEKDGSKTYSDRPIPGGQPVELSAAQTYTPAPQPIVPNGLPTEQQLLEQVNDFKYTSCKIQPPNDTSFTNPETVAVSVALTPELRVGHKLVVTVDGQPIPGADANAHSAVLPNVPRGTHTVALLVKNNFGKTLCNTTSVFHVLRPSVNAPARR